VEYIVKRNILHTLAALGVSLSVSHGHARESMLGSSHAQDTHGGKSGERVFISESALFDLSWVEEICVGICRPEKCSSERNAPHN